MEMKNVVANPVELRDAVRCEKKNISLTGGFAKMMQVIYKGQKVDNNNLLEKIDMPTFMKLALDPKTINTLMTTYQVAMKEDAQGIKLEYIKV